MDIFCAREINIQFMQQQNILLIAAKYCRKDVSAANFKKLKTGKYGRFAVDMRLC